MAPPGDQRPGILYMGGQLRADKPSKYLTRSTQLSIPLGSVKRGPASAGKAKGALFRLRINCVRVQNLLTSAYRIFLRWVRTFLASSTCPPSDIRKQYLGTVYVHVYH